MSAADASLYGMSRDGKPVRVFTLRNGRGMSVRLLDLGGTITAINVPGSDGAARNVVLGLADLAAYEASGTFNALVGRYANRLKNGFTLDDRHYELAMDKNDITLHGGRSVLYGNRLWEVLSSDARCLTLGLTSPDGDQGFPGTLKIAVTYSLGDDNSFRLDYKATTDRPTPINLTNHLYLNLAGSGTVERHLLEVMADHYTPTDAWQIPTGEIAPVANTALDFRTPMPVGARLRNAEPQMLIARGYDHNFVLRKTEPGALEPAVHLRDLDSGIVLTLSTSEPGLQIYSTNNVNGSQVSAAAAMIRQGDGLALETQHYPDSPNHPDFPSTLLRPGEVFASTTVFQFSRA